jgi:2-polyprenyl-3-methyl-5-hydroxy-6-metoxy-1,4-benzoquinol methylase
MNQQNNEKRLQESRQIWDAAAASFDDEPDHGLQNPVVREAWTKFLKAWLPAAEKAVLDIGCGTGSLSVVLAGLGHIVTGIDLSPAMIALAQAKAEARGYDIDFQVMDAAFPKFGLHQFDVIVCRHLLWALPEPKQVLQRWVEFLKPQGRLILIEGYWMTGAGLHAEELTRMLPQTCTNISIQALSHNPDFWGGAVTDERYALIADIV